MRYLPTIGLQSADGAATKTSMYRFAYKSLFFFSSGVFGVRRSRERLELMLRRLANFWLARAL
jgi:hypothetical protein